jgi:hypothetical protein
VAFSATWGAEKISRGRAYDPAMERLRALVVLTIVALLVGVIWQAGSTAPQRAQASSLATSR